MESRQIFKRESPEKTLAKAAIMKLTTTPGPATFLATIPLTKYIPVPTQEPTPKDVKSNVVRHFWKVETNETREIFRQAAERAWFETKDRSKNGNFILIK